MGLSIHYSGHFRRAEDLPMLVEEVVDVANVYGWRHKVYNTHFPKDTFDSSTSFENIYGVNFTPVNCETISLAFLSNGVMVCPARVSLFAHAENEAQHSYIYTVSAKTQFAGTMVHQLLIRLFKYLNDKYFENFKLSDESLYWETNDEALMRKQFKLYDTLLDNVVLSTKTFPIQQGEDMVSYFERLMKHIDNLKKDG